MTKDKPIPIGPTGEYTHILVPAKDYNLQSDTRLLIPFSIEERVGFADKEGNVVIDAKYVMCYGDFKKETDCVVVAKYYLYGAARADGSASVCKRPVYGVINIKGEEVIPVEYWKVIPLHLPSQNLFIVQDMEERYALLNEKKQQVIPFGKYEKLDFYPTFKVLKFAGSTSKWGIINENGKVLSLNEM